MAGDQAQFYQLLNTLLSTDNGIRSQAEVSTLYILCIHTLIWRIPTILPAFIANILMWPRVKTWSWRI